jgi:hypothetical protein
MARTRKLSPDFWTWEEVVACAPMTRLLFLGLWTFADDFGVQPLKPSTLRMRVFPGDAIDGDAVRAMIDELAAHGLVRLYSVDGQDYIAIVDWAQVQRVGKRARRRHPAEPSAAAPAVKPEIPDEPARWHAAITALLHGKWPGGSTIEAIPPAEIARWVGWWLARGFDLEEDVLPAIDERRSYEPPQSLDELAGTIDVNRIRRRRQERLLKQAA